MTRFYRVLLAAALAFALLAFTRIDVSSLTRKPYDPPAFCYVPFVRFKDAKTGKIDDTGVMSDTMSQP